MVSAKNWMKWALSQESEVFTDWIFVPLNKNGKLTLEWNGFRTTDPESSDGKYIKKYGEIVTRVEKKKKEYKFQLIERDEGRDKTEQVLTTFYLDEEDYILNNYIDIKFTNCFAKRKKRHWGNARAIRHRQLKFHYKRILEDMGFRINNIDTKMHGNGNMTEEEGQALIKQIKQHWNIPAGDYSNTPERRNNFWIKRQIRSRIIYVIATWA